MGSEIDTKKLLGRVFSFQYNGGTRSGQRRTVYCFEITDHNSIQTWDFDVEDIREYKLDHIQNRSDFLKHFIITPEFLPDSIDDIIEIKQKLNKGDNKACVDQERKCIIIVEQPKQFIKPIRSLNNSGLSFHNNLGKWVKIVINNRLDVFIVGTDFSVVRNPKVEDVIKFLQTLISD